MMNFANKIRIKPILYFLLIAIITYLAQVMITKYYLHAPIYWLIWTAFALSLTVLDGSIKRQFFLIIINSVGIAIGVLLATLLTQQISLSALYFFCLVFVISIFAQRYPKYLYGLLLIVCFSIIASNSFTSASITLWDVSLICLAGIIVAAIRSFFLFFISGTESKNIYFETIRQLGELNKDIFFCFVQPDYGENTYLYERRIHVTKNNFLQSFEQLKKMTLTIDLKSAIDCISLLYEIMISYSQLRWRVTDYSSFLLCKDEFSYLLETTNKVFLDFQTEKVYLNIEPLQSAIKRFEENFQHVLAIATVQPIHFYLFVQDLKLFSETCSKLANSLVKKEVG